MMRSFAKPLARTTTHARRMSNFIVAGGDIDVSADSILNSDGKKVLYFTAGWCNPAQMAFTLEKMKFEFPQLIFFQIDVVKQPELAAACNVTCAPMIQGMYGSMITAEVSADQITSNTAPILSDHL
jgi:hypothetical protein